MTDINLTCERFEAMLPDWMEHALDAGDRAAAERHLRDCARCAALVRDLDAIVHEAGALPVLAPSRDLWTGIAERIDTPVVAIGSAGERGGRGVTRRGQWLHLGAAAAALVLFTAGVTWSVAVRAMRDGGSADVAAESPSAPAAPRPTAPDRAAPAVASVAGAGPAAAATPSAPRRAVPDENVEPMARGTTPVTAVARVSETRRVYDREIAALARILEERRDVIDPVTAAILEHNLQIIDRAIADSREALRQDPASRFLGEQLDRALDKKLELMRTAALLPARS